MRHALILVKSAYEPLHGWSARCRAWRIVEGHRAQGMVLMVNMIRIGGASGYWGDADMAVPQFLADGNIDYIVFDYLAEITMSILARAKAVDASQGYATDFVSAVISKHGAALANAGIKLITNAGGVNPHACAQAVRDELAQQGLALRVAVIDGDDLLPELTTLTNTRDMFSGHAFPASDRVASANAYLGAFPIAMALNRGADIVITGRCVDSAVTLGAAIHAFGWGPHDLELLAMGSLAGHIIECGAQATGGNYTDWLDVADSLHSVGYPIAELGRGGALVITKPEKTGGAVTCGTVGEQLLYEIGDPAAYALPDVICDFTAVTLEQIDVDRVAVAGARGTGIPSHYKACVTWADGWRGGASFFYVGDQAARKARIFADEALKRTRSKLTVMTLPDFDEVCVEVIGDESHYGVAARPIKSREVMIKVACKHADKRAVGLLLRELTGAALGAPPGLCMFAGTRPKPSPVVRLFSALIPKDVVAISVSDEVGSDCIKVEQGETPTSARSVSVPAVVNDEPLTSVPLIQLAYVRSGDKGDQANIGVMARDPRYLPWIARSLCQEEVARRFGHFLVGADVRRFYLPGTHALNFVLNNVLGGGGTASLRNDPQGKAYGQILLDAVIEIPASLVESVSDA